MIIFLFRSLFIFYVKTHSSKKKIFGDYQTPINLVNMILNLVKTLNINPKTIIEPQCGLGSFVIAVRKIFPEVDIFAMDINSSYIEKLQESINKKSLKNIFIEQSDFFKKNWTKFLSESKPKSPLLIIGNPPWITTSEISLLTKEENKIPKVSKNVTQKPIKHNIHGLSGINAITGEGNFDISESMIITLLDALITNKFKSSYLMMICKFAVARNIFNYLSKKEISGIKTRVFKFNSKKYFNVTVEACVLVCSIDNSNSLYDTCSVYDSLVISNLQEPSQIIGLTSNKELIANIVFFNKWKHLLNDKTSQSIEWRSGIKHDSSKIMELKKIEKEGKFYYINGFKQINILEDTYLYPMLKSSDLANDTTTPTKWMLVTQNFIGKETETIVEEAPLTWKYLMKNKYLLDKRASVIYKNKPKFSIFGVGDYSFSKWKVAISGFYKKLDFRLIQPYRGKTVVLDDTCYFIACETFEKAVLLELILNNKISKEFYLSFIFWDAKRPITKKLLRKISIKDSIEEIGENYLLSNAEKKHSSLKFDILEKELNKLKYL